MLQLDRLLYWKDVRHLSPARNMALDQALFKEAGISRVANLRLYQWGSPARTVGYFHQFESATGTEIRRFTGGGIVDHGIDLTFSLSLPACSTATPELYRWIHRTLVLALSTVGFHTVLEAVERSSAGGDCFTQPVTSDILDADGAKIGGGAQRRSRGSVIHQGSIRLPVALRDPEAGWIDEWIGNLAEVAVELPSDRKQRLDITADRLVHQRYATQDWNRWR